MNDLTRRIFSSIPLLIFGLLWCGFLAVVDTFALRGFIQQMRATGFPTTSGVVSESQVKITRGSKGKRTHRAEIAYSYAANDREWTSNRVGYSVGTFGDGSSHARQLVAAFPVGKEVTVYYDPASPGEAMLKPGLQPEHLLIALFMTPHHMVGLGLLLGALGPLWRGVRGEPDMTLRPLDDLRMAVRMPWMSPLWVGIITLGITSFVGIFMAAFAFSQFPSMATAIGIWLVIFGITAFTVLRRRARIKAGLADLVIDASARTVSLPLGEGRKERVMLPFTDIHGVTVRVSPSTTRTTKRGWTVTTTRKPGMFYLALIDQNESPTKLVTSKDEEKLRAIADALSKTFGWPLS